MLVLEEKKLNASGAKQHYRTPMRKIINFSSLKDLMVQVETEFHLQADARRQSGPKLLRRQQEQKNPRDVVTTVKEEGNDDEDEDVQTSETGASSTDEHDEEDEQIPQTPFDREEIDLYTPLIRHTLSLSPRE
jgi:hypothetical protein